MEQPSAELTGLALQRRYLESLNTPHYGPPDGPFIMLNEEHSKVWVFHGEKTLEVVTVDFENESQNFLMEQLQLFRAQFSVAADGTVSCQIGRVVAVGDSYATAGMRACILSRKPS